jgi:hypothetical protein
MHPVLVLASAISPNTNRKLVAFLPLVSLHSEKLDEAHAAARQSSSISPSPPATPGNSHILLDQSWNSDSTHNLALLDTTLFPLAKLAPLSLRTKNQFLIRIDRAWTIDSSCLTPYPPRRSWSARGKALPNPLMFLAPESLEWVLALHVQKVAAATPILGTRSSFATTRSGLGSAWTTPKTVSSEATMPSDVGEEEVKSRKLSGLNVKAKEFVPLFAVKVAENLESEQEKEEEAEVKVEEMLEAALEEAEREEPLLEQLTGQAVKEVEDEEEEVTLFEQWRHIAVMLVDELVTANDLEATEQLDVKAVHEKKPIVTCRKESRFFRDKLPLFNAGKATPKCEVNSDTAPVIETGNPQQEKAIAIHEEVSPIKVVDKLSNGQVEDYEGCRSSEQAGDEWGDWSCVHSKWNSKAKKPKKVHWKELDW